MLPPSSFRVKAEPDVTRLYGKSDMNEQRKNVVTNQNFGRKKDRQRTLSGLVAIGKRKV
jgi:hypothetical protein